MQLILYDQNIYQHLQFILIRSVDTEVTENVFNDI